MLSLIKAASSGLPPQLMKCLIRSGILRQVEYPTCHHSRQLCAAAEGDAHYPLTYREAVSYLEDVLHIPDCQKLADKNPLHFLNRVTTETKRRIPFTIIPYYTKGSHQIPSTEEGKNLMLTRQGGNCTIINPFTAKVLKRLGLQTYCFPVSSYRLGGSHLLTHVGIVVENATQPGSLHLCDPGSLMLTFETIPLDFESSSPVYTQYQQPLKYFRASLGAINFCRLVDRAELGSRKRASLFHFEDGQFWEELFIYNINKPIDLAYIDDSLRNLPEDFDFLRASGNVFISGFPDGLMVDISLRRCLTMDEHGVKKVIRNSDLAGLQENVRKFFPHVPPDRVTSAAEYITGRMPFWGDQ